MRFFLAGLEILAVFLRLGDACPEPGSAVLVGVLIVAVVMSPLPAHVLPSLVDRDLPGRYAEDERRRQQRHDGRA